LSVSSYSNGRQVCANAGPFDNASLEIEYTQLANNKVSVKLLGADVLVVRRVKALIFLGT
jgi:hypothetical protein